MSHDHDTANVEIEPRACTDPLGQGGRARASDRASLRTAASPLCLLALYSLTYAFVPPAIEPLVQRFVESYAPNYTNVGAYLDAIGPRVLLTTAACFSATVLLYILTVGKLSALIRLAFAIPIWPVLFFLLFEAQRPTEQFSKIAVYLEVVLSFLTHIAMEAAILQSRFPERSRWDVASTWKTGLLFVAFIGGVPVMYLLARGAAVQTPGTSSMTEWYAVLSFSTYALVFALLISLIHLRLPENLIYLLRLPARPPRLFMSYAEPDEGTMRAVRTRLEAHGVIADEYQSGMVKSEHIHDWIVERIHDADIVVLIVSDDSLRSEWVQMEHDAAIAAQIPVLYFGARPVDEVNAWQTALARAIRKFRILADRDLEKRLDQLLTAVLELSRSNLNPGDRPRSDPTV